MASTGKAQNTWFWQPWGISLVCFLVASAIMSFLIYKDLAVQANPCGEVGAGGAIYLGADCSFGPPPQLALNYSIMAYYFSYGAYGAFVIPFDILLPALFIGWLVYSRNHNQKLRSLLIRPLFIISLVGLYTYLIYAIYRITQYWPLFIDSSSSIAINAWDAGSAVNYLPIDLLVTAALLVIIPVLARKYRVLA